MEDNKNSKIAFAILAGVAAGAATWYFMSTENGKHNWVTLINTVKDLTDKLIESGSEGGSFLASAGREASEYIGQKTNSLVDETRKYS